MKVQLRMGDVQTLMTAVSESRTLSENEKFWIRVKLDDMQDELRTHNKLMVVGIPNSWLNSK